MAKHVKLRTYLEYAPVKLVLMTLGHLPAPAAYWIGRSFGKLAYRLAGDLRRTGAINLRLAFPEKTEAERAALVVARLVELLADDVDGGEDPMDVAVVIVEREGGVERLQDPRLGRGLAGAGARRPGQREGTEVVRVGVNRRAAGRRPAPAAPRP